ncbi:hypothetical protein C1H46_019180 [Malus baccata]|uniref:Protein kinase domain-containing protein n=1 Tax=Malus baccata TaxID=106549 RepID=A0A540M921_MALBA|nr:hypothetical protein C1H46_019180 [Malus baccata]
MTSSLSSSSPKRDDKTRSFHLAELSTATKHFSTENKIGAGSFGIVYKGKLSDGREVAIKGRDTSTKAKKFQGKESNGLLHDHLHGKNNVEENSSIVNFWKVRIKIVFDAAKGIKYLHNYAVPSSPLTFFWMQIGMQGHLILDCHYWGF